MLEIERYFARDNFHYIFIFLKKTIESLIERGTRVGANLVNDKPHLARKIFYKTILFLRYVTHTNFAII